MVESIGVGGMSNADDVYIGTVASWRRLGVDASWTRRLVIGEELRDWDNTTASQVFFPYDASLSLRPIEGSCLRALWPWRSVLWSRAVFGGGTYRSASRSWYEWHQVTKERYATPLSICFASVASHNHFVLERGEKVFKQSSPIVKLAAAADEAQHLALLAYLNSSTACFWMKQVFYPKASAVKDLQVGGFREEDNRYDFAATGMLAMPLPPLPYDTVGALAGLARRVLAATEVRMSASSSAVISMVAAGIGRDEAIRQVEETAWQAQQQQVAAQEDIDWLVYALFDMALPSLGVSTLQKAAPAERPYLAGVSGSGVPDAWQARAKHLASSQELQIIETDNYKRQWAGRRGIFGHGAKTLAEASRDAAVDLVQERAEAVVASQLAPMALAELAAKIGVDQALGRVATTLVTQQEPLKSIIVGGDAVPFLAALRLNDAGLATWNEWLQCWDLQRREDAGEAVGEIPVPPKYKPTDFLDARYFRLRGKLDVPKERFISYPGCESDDDGEPVYGWAGWDHLQRAQALAALYMDRKTREGWPRERLVPMLAGLLELIPWVKQWHNEPSAEYDGLRMGDYFAQFLDGELRLHSLTPADLRAWRPAKKSRGKPKPAPAAAAAADAADAPPPKPKRPRKPKAPTGQEGEA